MEESRGLKELGVGVGEGNESIMCMEVQRRIRPNHIHTSVCMCFRWDVLN